MCGVGAAQFFLVQKGLDGLDTSILTRIKALPLGSLSA